MKREVSSNEIVIEVSLGNHRLKMLKVVLIVEDADREDQQERGSYIHATSESEKEDEAGLKPKETLYEGAQA